MSDLDLLTVQRGTVTAPAGCGKTQLIADTLKRHCDARPTLVLTHTNAGKAALEQRLQRAQVPKHAYRLFTIDSWAVRLACRFPARSGVGMSVRQVENPRTDYPAVRAAVAKLLRAGHINDPLTSTYCRMFVDEYQDCGLVQHDIVLAVAEVLPTVVFGDPLQAIFTFSGPTVRWKTNVWSEFPDVVRLTRPWRWENVGAQALGQWLLDIRRALSLGQPVDLRQAPAEVVWVRLDGDEAAVHRQRMDAARSRAPNKDGTVVVIGESLNPAGQRRIASVTPGAVVVEAVDLRDFTAFGRAFKPAGGDAVERLISFAADMMTQLSERALLKRIEVLQRGSARTPASPVEEAALAFGRNPTFGTAAEALKAFAAARDVRIYRPDVFRMCVAALQAAEGGETSFGDAVVRERERNRHMSRGVARRAVGSTLLLKGLEADVSVVLYPEEMDGRNLYVALSRGARRLIVCSPTPVLTPVTSTSL
jgi:hypothetical protein